MQPMPFAWLLLLSNRVAVLAYAFYRRIKSRLGALKAISATAHKLARFFYLIGHKVISMLILPIPLEFRKSLFVKCRSLIPPL